jgi:hypothetical protein
MYSLFTYCFCSWELFALEVAWCATTMHWWSHMCVGSKGFNLMVNTHFLLDSTVHCSQSEGTWTPYMLSTYQHSMTSCRVVLTVVTLLKTFSATYRRSVCWWASMSSLRLVPPCSCVRIVCFACQPGRKCTHLVGCLLCCRCVSHIASSTARSQVSCRLTSECSWVHWTWFAAISTCVPSAVSLNGFSIQRLVGQWPTFPNGLRCLLWHTCNRKRHLHWILRLLPEYLMPTCYLGQVLLTVDCAYTVTLQRLHSRAIECTNFNDRHQSWLKCVDLRVTWQS